MRILFKFLVIVFLFLLFIEITAAGYYQHPVGTVSTYNTEHKNTAENLHNVRSSNTPVWARWYRIYGGSVGMIVGSVIFYLYFFHKKMKNDIR